MYGDGMFTPRTTFNCDTRPMKLVCSVNIPFHPKKKKQSSSRLGLAAICLRWRVRAGGLGLSEVECSIRVSVISGE